jgi:hypothetical protein
MYGNQHPITFKREKGEKIVFGLSFKELFWWGLGIWLCTRMYKLVPPLPIDNIIAKYMHYLLPLMFCLFIGYTEERKTGLTISKYIQYYIRERKRKRTLLP